MFLKIQMTLIAVLLKQYNFVSSILAKTTQLSFESFAAIG